MKHFHGLWADRVHSTPNPAVCGCAQFRPAGIYLGSSCGEQTAEQSKTPDVFASYRKGNLPTVPHQDPGCSYNKSLAHADRAGLPARATGAPGPAPSQQGREREA